MWSRVDRHATQAVSRLFIPRPHRSPPGQPFLTPNQTADAHLPRKFEVGRLVEQHGDRGTPIAPGSPDLLVETVEILWDAEMQY